MSEQQTVSRVRVILGFTAVCLIWGSTWLVIKEGIQVVPPFLSAALRFVVASLLLRLVMVQQKESVPTSPSFWKLMVEIGLFSYGIPFALVYWGQTRIPSGLAAVLFATFPFFVALMARLRIPNERLALANVAGIVLGFAGVLLIFSSELRLDQPVSLVGMVAIIASAALQAFAIISVRLKAESIHPVTLTFGGMLVGALTLTPLSLIFEDWGTAQFTVGSVGAILYLALFGSVVTFVSYFWLVKHIHPVMLALTAFITPIIAVYLGSAVGGERLGTEVMEGVALVLVGVVVANTPGIRTAIDRRARRSAA